MSVEITVARGMRSSQIDVSFRDNAQQLADAVLGADPIPGSMRHPTIDRLRRVGTGLIVGSLLDIPYTPGYLNEVARQTPRLTRDGYTYGEDGHIWPGENLIQLFEEGRDAYTTNGGDARNESDAPHALHTGVVLLAAADSAEYLIQLSGQHDIPPNGFHSGLRRQYNQRVPSGTFTPNGYGDTYESIGVEVSNQNHGPVNGISCLRVETRVENGIQDYSVTAATMCAASVTRLRLQSDVHTGSLHESVTPTIHRQLNAATRSLTLNRPPRS